MRPLIFIMCTYDRPNRLAFVKRHLDFLISRVENYILIIVEDGATTDPEVSALLVNTNSIYLTFGPTRDKGNAQRNHALKFIRDRRMLGVVYNLDDDNLVHPALCYELRQVQSLAIFPAGNLGPTGVERPIIRDKVLVGWSAGWAERKYPVDMAGFAFHSSLLDTFTGEVWTHTGLGGETEFIETLVSRGARIDFSLCLWNRFCFALHNEPL